MKVLKNQFESGSIMLKNVSSSTKVFWKEKKISKFAGLVLSFTVMLLFSLFRPFIKNTNGLVLIGSNYGQSKDPNAIVLYEYVKKQGHPVLFVGAERSDNTIKRGWSSTFFFLQSTYVFYTHSLSDIVPQGHRIPFMNFFSRNKSLVFMQHGVLGFKTAINERKSIRDYLLLQAETFDFMVVSSNKEKKLVMSLGIPSAKVSVTGLPRFDMYYGRFEMNSSVLVFFTWGDEAQHNNKVTEVEESVGMKFLQAAGYDVFYKTHNMLNSNESGDALSSLVATSELLITDDSSIAWDFFYRGGDVVFYKPSCKWFVDDAFFIKKTARNQRELNDSIIEFLRTKPDYEKNQFAKFYDNHNSSRVFELAFNSGKLK